MEELFGKKLAKLDLCFFEHLSQGAFSDDTLFLLFKAAAEHERDYPNTGSLRFLFLNDSKAFIRSADRNAIHIYELPQLDLPDRRSQYILLLVTGEPGVLTAEAARLYAELLQVLKRKRIRYHSLKNKEAFFGKGRVRILRIVSLQIGAAAVRSDAIGMT
ncbi:hypothetical protein [Saccharibacillus kuerlensis]|uniref:Uncharacterized protein n=1 Tax=Saccharibacillus kuerlensis TaxID=459527 RepID=A0ABQ2LAK9_9BACL|nr:hypothetical protein [Saccharibacillus kuerlensis]GGO06578.1 hypothetical protein GCM10010969_34230 [Saccharibacillus kuerlensis]